MYLALWNSPVGWHCVLNRSTGLFPSGQVFQTSGLPTNLNNWTKYEFVNLLIEDPYLCSSPKTEPWGCSICRSTTWFELIHCWKPAPRGLRELVPIGHWSGIWNGAQQCLTCSCLLDQQGLNCCSIQAKARPLRAYRRHFIVDIMTAATLARLLEVLGEDSHCALHINTKHNSSLFCRHCEVGGRWYFDLNWLFFMNAMKQTATQFCYSL